MKALTGSVYFKNKLFDNQMVRTMGHCRYGGPDFGECFAAAFEIEDGNWESWLPVWKALSDRIFESAVSSLERGHRLSAHRAFLKASEAYRTAGFALLDKLGDPRDLPIMDRIRESFTRAGELSDNHQFETIEIPFENIHLNGYLMRPSAHGTARGTLIFNQGYHGMVEEVYFWGGKAALDRGWNVLAFDGPGQGHVLHRQGVVFRKDWEKVVTAVLDWAATKVDPSRLALVGRSFGANLAAMAATHDHRLAALILDPGELDQYRNFVSGYPENVQAAFETNDIATLEAFFAKFLEAPDKKFAYVSRMLANGVATPWELVLAQRAYTIVGREHLIQCPTLVTAASHDDRGTVQPQIVYDALTCPKKLIHFSAADGAGDHCEAGAPSLFEQHALDWLDETLP